MCYNKRRLAALSPSKSFFLFGIRNTGQSTLLKHVFESKACLWIDLLDPELEEQA